MLKSELYIQALVLAVAWTKKRAEPAMFFFWFTYLFCSTNTYPKGPILDHRSFSHHRPEEKQCRSDC